MGPVALAAIAAVALAAHPASSAEVTYFEVPRGAHPHDVAPAPDGSVWYTAQFQGALGILNPKTGQATEIALGAGSSPHGVIVGPDRAAWITDGGQNAIARFVATKAVKLFRAEGIPGANLNTATFDRKGILWFTGQSGVYGRVDPSSGKVEAWKAPKGTGPYGITMMPNGEVWYALLAGDHIAKIDTVSGDALMVLPPKPGVGPRRIWSDSKGLLWVSFWNTGEIGRYDPTEQGMESLEPAEEQGRAVTPSMSTTTTRFGSRTSSPTPLSGSIRRPRPSRASRATSAVLRSGNCLAGRARFGVRSPASTGWS